jgi:predicted DCC family thiol-disulfide oxidoreductase YuxK
MTKKICSMISELTAITDIKELKPARRRLKGRARRTLDPSREPRSARARDSFRGWILYDGECSSCTGSARRFDPIFRRRGFFFLPLQTSWVLKRLGLDHGTPLEEMHVLTADDRDICGADALIFLAGQIWWAWPFYLLAKIPTVHGNIDRVYRWIAAHRGCDHIARDLGERRLGSGPSQLVGRINLATASLRPHRRGRQWFLESAPGWILLIMLPISILVLRDRVAPWQFMWLMAGAIFFGCKWLTAWRALRLTSHLKLVPTLGYFFAWPGIDAEKFVAPKPSHAQLDFFKQSSLALSRRRVWPAIAKILLGAVLLFGAARVGDRPLLAGWIGMIGMILILHFGLFQLLAVAWRRAGVGVERIMNAPLRSKSISEFWGRRWNAAFNRLAFDFVFRPLSHAGGARRSCGAEQRSGRSSTLHLGTTIATLAVFLVSGLIHELVISFPAHAGYGWPTAYFLLQGIGILAERAFPHIRSRIFTILITAVPAFWLFHPPFVHKVILPFMKAIGAL